VLSKNEIKLKLENLRLISLCKTALREIESLEDIIIDNVDSQYKRSYELQNALNLKNSLSYIHEYPILYEEFNELINLYQKKD